MLRPLPPALATLDAIPPYIRSPPRPIPALTHACIGFMGLNNIKANDYINAVIQALNQVRPLRDFFLANPPAMQGHSELVKRLGIVIRKLWYVRSPSTP